MERINKLKARTFKKEKVPLPRGFENFQFPLQNNLDLEIGCGVGLHPILYAKKNPERTLIAIEHTKVKFEKFKNRLDKHDLRNIIPVHANAISWIAHLVPDNSIENIYILYPNPNPKASDISKRWHAMPFMNLLFKKIKKKGFIHFATNEEFYAEEIHLYFQECWGLECILSLIHI